MYAMELMRMSDLELLEEYERLVMYKVMYKDNEFANRVELIRNELLRRMK
jgi:hypothetical protein